MSYKYRSWKGARACSRQQHWVINCIAESLWIFRFKCPRISQLRDIFNLTDIDETGRATRAMPLKRKEAMPLGQSPALHFCQAPTHKQCLELCNTSKMPVWGPDQLNHFSTLLAVICVWPHILPQGSLVTAVTRTSPLRASLHTQHAHCSALQLIL